MIYKVLPAIPGTFEGFFRDALLRAAAENSHLANISLSTEGGYIPIVGLLDDFVRDNRITAVVAAGNSAESIHSFAEAKNVITIGAINTGNFGEGVFPDAGCIESNWPPGQVSCFSSFGPVDSDGDGLTRIKPDLVAPGMQIPVSTVASGPIYGYDRLPGTSLAAPAVTGVIAAMLDWNSLFVFQPERTKAVLLANALDIGGPLQRNFYGYGLPNAYNLAFYVPDRSAQPVSGTWEITHPDTSLSYFFFPVAGNHYYTRVVLLWSDMSPIIENPNGSFSLGDEIINRFQLRVYNNASCSGIPIGIGNSLDSNVIVIDFLGENVLVPPGGQTWCARAIILDKDNFLVTPANPQRLAIASFSAAKPPELITQIDNNVLEPLTTQSFTITTTVTNTGIPAGGAYIKLFVPNGFYLLYAKLTTRDGREQIYGILDLYTVEAPEGKTYYLSIGQVPFERIVEWLILPDSAPPAGAYLFTSAASFWLRGVLVTENDSNTMICLDSSGIIYPCPRVFLPLLNHN